MKQKKSLIIVVSVLAVCLIGVAISQVFDWPVNKDQTSGNVAKSSRFSRKTAQEAASNMQELLLNDEGYKNSMVAAYLVMKTRAQQFGALVDMSEEVAGGIPEFASVLKDMKAARPMVENVCASMEKAGKDLDAALGGETPKELAQNTSNAALAYTTLQKQNSLATRFIDTADAYLAKTNADDRLKFVRDQWVEYQQLTAILENDEKAAAELEEKGHLLSADQTLAAVQTFGMAEQIIVITNSCVGQACGVSSEALESAGSAQFIETLANQQGLANQSVSDQLIANQQALASQQRMANQQGSASPAITDEVVSSAVIASRYIISFTSVGDLVNLQQVTGTTSFVNQMAGSSEVISNTSNTIRSMAEGQVVANTNTIDAR